MRQGLDAGQPQHPRRALEAVRFPEQVFQQRLVGRRFFQPQQPVVEMLQALPALSLEQLAQFLISNHLLFRSPGSPISYSQTSALSDSATSFSFTTPIFACAVPAAISLEPLLRFIIASDTWLSAPDCCLLFSITCCAPS